MDKRLLVFVLIGAVAGMMAGLLGIGGGIILVPALTAILLLKQHQAHGTSLAIVPFIGLPAAVTYALYGHMDWLLMIELAAGSMTGAVIGAKLMMRVPAPQLRRLFSLLVIASGIIMVIGIEL